MNFLKKNYILISILVLGAFLRINLDTFITGYNYDEFAIVSIARLDFINMIKSIATQDYHAPLYYFIAHIFAGSDCAFLYLRFLNIAFSLINIFVFYKIGNLIFNKKAGLIFALFLAVSHIEIINTNFIKFYCLDFLLVSSIIYFGLNYSIKKTRLKFFTTANILLTLGFTFGYMFSFFAFLFLYLKNKEKIIIKHLGFCTIGLFFYLPILFFQTKMAFSNILGIHGTYPSLSLSAFYILFNDYFSPLVNYACNSESIESMPLLIKCIKCLTQHTPFDHISLFGFILLSFIPTIIGLFGMFFAIKKEKMAQLIFRMSLGYLIPFLILIKLEITGFVPTYLFPVGISFIILSLWGLNLINSKIKYVLITYLICSHLIVPNVYPIDKRETPYKIYGNIDEYVKKIDDNIPIVVFDAGRFTKSYYKEKNIFALDYEQIQGMNGRKMIEILYGEEFSKRANTKNYKELLKPIILNNLNTGTIDKHLEENLFSKIKKNEKMILILNLDASPFIYTDSKIKEILNMNYEYHLGNSSIFYQASGLSKKRITVGELGEVALSHSMKLISKEIEKKFKIVKIEQFTPQKKSTYKKTFETSEIAYSTLDLLKMPIAGWIFVTYQKK